MQAITKVVLDVTLQVLSSVYTIFIVHCVIVFFFFLIKIVEKILLGNNQYSFCMRLVSVKDISG